MRNRRHTLLVMMVLLVLTAPATSDDEFRYIQRETREASREATLAQYLPVMQVGPWHVIGPYDNAGMDRHDVVYPPETGVMLDRPDTGKDGRTVRWERVDDEAWSRIDFKRFGTEEDNTYGIAYAYREFEAVNAGEVTFEMGSDDGLKVWVNDRLLVDADVYRGMNLQDHIVKVPVQAGRNTVLVKVTQGVGGWEFQMRPRIDSRVVVLTEYYLNRDFPVSREFVHYRPLSILEPEDVVIEVGGLDIMPDGRPIVSTRRGEVWVVENAYEDPPFNPVFKRFAFGLHEPLGAAWHDDGLLVVQRGEVTHLVDTNGDDKADVFRTVTDGWGVSGNYHEFAFGPEFDGQGRPWVTLNVGFCASLGKSIVPWRGWALTFNERGEVTPVCGGLRSPNGIGRNADGEMFCTDNQGDWVGTNKLMHLSRGDWHGHPSSERWYEQAGMPTPNGEADFKPPAVWFPYDQMGRSASDILLDDTGGRFGPYDGQLFVGDQYAAAVMRVSLEQVNGAYQGACYPFISNLDCGVNRLCWAPDGSLLVGMTNRGWWSEGSRPWGLQRIVYTGVLPFEIHEMRARPGGFELTFTKPVDTATAGAPGNYMLQSYTHHRWEKYGSPEIERRELRVRRVDIGSDGRSVRLYVDGLRERFVHELTVTGLRSSEGESLLHDEAYYTLNAIPTQ